MRAICCVRLSESDIIPNRTLKKRLFLRNHAYFISQSLYIVLLYIGAVNKHAPVRHIVKSWYKINKRAFA